MSQLAHLQDLIPVLPEIALALGAMFLLMAGVVLGERSAALINSTAILLLIVVAVLVVLVPGGRHVLFNGSFVVDEYARFLKLLALTGSTGALLLSLDYLHAERQEKFEYGILFLLATLGMLMLISAADQ